MITLFPLYSAIFLRINANDWLMCHSVPAVRFQIPKDIMFTMTTNFNTEQINYNFLFTQFYKLSVFFIKEFYGKLLFAVSFRTNEQFFINQIVTKELDKMTYTENCQCCQVRCEIHNMCTTVSTCAHIHISMYIVYLYI